MMYVKKLAQRHRNCYIPEHVDDAASDDSEGNASEDGPWCTTVPMDPLTRRFHLRTSAASAARDATLRP